MNTFEGNNGRARTREEVRAYAAQAHGAVLVEGFGRALRTPGAQYVDGVTGRVASFLEYYPRGAYYLREDSPGEIAWETEAVPQDAQGDCVVAAFAMGMGMGNPLPQPTGYFTLAVEGAGEVPFCVRNYSEQWAHDGIALRVEVRRYEHCAPGQTLCLDSYITAEHAAMFGIGYVKLPLTDAIRGRPLRLTVRGHTATATTRFFKLDTAGDMLALVNIYPGLSALFAGRRAHTQHGYNVYFGDIHTHSGQDNIVENTGCGYGSIDENYWYARHVSMLDFYALTDHDWGIMPSHAWPRQVEACDAHNAPGVFCTIPAFEWTSEAYGHRNVYYADTPGTLAVSRDTPGGPMTPEALWEALDACGTPYITVPHHPSATSHPFTFEHYNPDRDRLVEIYSSWGSSEYAHCEYSGDGADRYEDNYVVDGLRMGWQVGFVASSDGHDGHPGNAQGPGFFHPHLAHYLGSGRVAVLAERLDRASVFEALHSRRCYATTGAPMQLSFTANGQLMGSEIRGVAQGETVSIAVEVKGTTRMRRLEIVSGGTVVCAVEGSRRDWDTLRLAWSGPLPQENAYFYAKAIQADGEMAWSSPVYFA